MKSVLGFLKSQYKSSSQNWCLSSIFIHDFGKKETFIDWYMSVNMSFNIECNDYQMNMCDLI